MSSTLLVGVVAPQAVRCARGGRVFFIYLFWSKEMFIFCSKGSLSASPPKITAVVRHCLS